MSGVTNEEVLRAVNASRDTTTAQMGGIKAAVDHLAEAIQAHEQRISALEDITGSGARLQPVAAAVSATSAVVAPMATDMRELLNSYNRDKAMREAKSQLSLEAEALEAKEIARAKRRKEAITWALGALFVFANILTIVKGLR